MDSQRAISEVYEILSHMSKEDRQKFNKNAIEFLKKHRNKEYKSGIDYTKPLSEQSLGKGTMALLTVYYIIGFCDTKEKKQEVLKILKENQRKKDSESSL